MAARIIDLADAAAAAIRAVWQPTAPDEVARVYAPKVGLAGTEGVPLLLGRKVYVFPGSYGGPGLATRGEYEDRRTLGVLVVERYAGAGQPPDAWVDDRVSWVEQCVYQLLRNPHTPLSVGGNGTVLVDPDDPDAASVDVLYDQDLLQQRQAFWSALTFRFTELETTP